MPKLVITSALIFLLTAGSAFAADSVGAWGGAQTRTGNSGPIMTPPHIIATTTSHVPVPVPPPFYNGTSSWEGGKQPWTGTSTMPHPRPIPPFRHLPAHLPTGLSGIVSSVATSSFYVDWPDEFQRYSTTTITVNVTASTTYQAMPASSTPASFASLATGERVVVFGSVSTSTMSITASRVLIFDMPNRGRRNGWFEQLLNIFGVHTPDADSSSSGNSAAAVQGSGGIMGFLHSIFGWL